MAQSEEELREILNRGGLRKDAEAAGTGLYPTQSPVRARAGDEAIPWQYSNVPWDFIRFYIIFLFPFLAAPRL
jgi:hypothetical protein